MDDKDTENDWIADIGSFHSGKPSQLFIEAVEPSVILQVYLRLAGVKPPQEKLF